MHLSVQFNHFNRALWVAVQCEASGASEATPAVAEASKSTCNPNNGKLLRLEVNGQSSVDTVWGQAVSERAWDEHLSSMGIAVVPLIYQLHILSHQKWRT